MQVDTAALRKMAAQLQDGVAEALEQAVRPLDPSHAAGQFFGQYVEAAAYGNACAAWRDEVLVLQKAAAELAQRLIRSADDYDRSDQAAARRVAATR
jgi:hypothetical protein